MLIFNVPNIISVFYEEENDLFIHEWLDYNPEGQDDVILKILQKLFDSFSTYPASRVIVRAHQTQGAFSPEIQDYIANTQIPKLEAKTNLRYVVTIQSRETMKAISTSLWQAPFDTVEKITLHDVESEKEAREWLKNLD